MESLQAGTDVLFILIGAVMVLAMHAGFAFLELGTVRAKNQVNALAKIMSDFAISTIAYFLSATVWSCRSLRWLRSHAPFRCASGGLCWGRAIYGLIKRGVGMRLTEEEYLGADLSIHKITAQPDYNRGEV